MRSARRGFTRSRTRSSPETPLRHELAREVRRLVVGHDPHRPGVANEHAGDAAMVRGHPKPLHDGGVESPADQVTDQVAMADDELRAVGTARAKELHVHGVGPRSIFALLRGGDLVALDACVDPFAEEARVLDGDAITERVLHDDRRGLLRARQRARPHAAELRRLQPIRGGTRLIATERRERSTAFGVVLSVAKEDERPRAHATHTTTYAAYDVESLDRGRTS